MPDDPNDIPINKKCPEHHLMSFQVEEARSQMAKLEDCIEAMNLRLTLVESDTKAIREVVKETKETTSETNALVKKMTWTFISLLLTVLGSIVIVIISGYI